MKKMANTNKKAAFLRLNGKKAALKIGHKKEISEKLSLGGSKINLAPSLSPVTRDDLQVVFFLLYE